MTIYLAIVKEFLIRNITNWQTTSISRDQSFINVTFSMFGGGRDTELSALKRQTANALIQGIQRIETYADMADDDYLKSIEKLLTMAKMEAETEARKKGYTNESSFPQMTTKSYQIAKDILEKFKKFDLLNIQYASTDPFDIYRFFLASYLAQKVYDTHHPSIVKYYIEHPKISNMPMLSAQREELVGTALNDCVKKLLRLDKSNNDYPNARKESVIESIEALKRSNEALCEKFGVKLAIPIVSIGIASVNLGMPALQPDAGCIELCMEAAISAIRQVKIPATTAAVETKTSHIEHYFKKVSRQNTPELDRDLNPAL